MALVERHFNARTRVAEHPAVALKVGAKQRLQIGAQRHELGGQGAVGHQRRKVQRAGRGGAFPLLAARHAVRALPRRLDREQPLIARQPLAHRHARRFEREAGRVEIRVAQPLHLGRRGQQRVRQQSGHIVGGQGELEFGFGGHGWRG